MAAQTLDHLSGGRFVLGLGVSGPQVVEGWYGQSFPAPLARTREYVDIVRQVLRAHEYWRLKNLAVDLVILNEKGASYSSELQDMLEGLVRANQATPRPEVQATGGAVFVLRAQRLSMDDRMLLMTAARITLLSRHGTLSRQMERLEGPAQVAEALPFWPRPKALPRAPAPALRLRVVARWL